MAFRTSKSSVDATVCEYAIDSMAVEPYSLHREDGWEFCCRKNVRCREMEEVVTYQFQLGDYTISKIRVDVFRPLLSLQGHHTRGVVILT